MDILNAVESYFKSVIDENAFRINTCVKDQTKENAFEDLIKIINTFANARAGYEIVQNLKAQLQLTQQKEESETADDS